MHNNEEWVEQAIQQLNTLNALTDFNEYWQALLSVSAIIPDDCSIEVQQLHDQFPNEPNAPIVVTHKGVAYKQVN